LSNRNEMALEIAKISKLFMSFEAGIGSRHIGKTLSDITLEGLPLIVLTLILFTFFLVPY